MNEQKELYLHRIRSQSAYPLLRKVATFVAFLFYSIAFLIVLVAVKLYSLYGLFALPVALLVAIAGGVLKEISIMVADIADSVTDLNCRYEQ
jgi:hypothetical protein